MALLDALFGRRATLDVGYPRNLGKSNGVTIDASDWPGFPLQNPFMSAVERQRRRDMLFLQIGACPPRVEFTFLTPLQKTAYAYWRDTTDLEFPGATKIQIEILRELRRVNTRR